MISLEGLAGTMSFNYQLGASVEQCQWSSDEGQIYGQGLPLPPAPPCVPSSPTLLPARPVWGSQLREGSCTRCHAGCAPGVHAGAARAGGREGATLSQASGSPLAASCWPDSVGQGCLGKKSKREKATGPFKVAEVIWDGRDDGGADEDK